MFNRSKYGKLLKVTLIIVILSVIGIIGIVGYKMYNEHYIITGAKEVISKFEEEIKNNGRATIGYKDFNVAGIIRIPDIYLEYPILKENTPEALETSLVLMYTSQGLNNPGNSVIIGHNYRNEIMFSRLDELKERDAIYITDTTGRKTEYRIYSIYTTEENENNYITRNTEGKKEISLSTSTDDSKSKLVILAREKQEI